jgi:hypothetical protein
VKKTYFGSTPFVPPGFDGLIRVMRCPIETVRKIASSAIGEGRAVSYIGHPETANFLGLPVSRDQVDLQEFQGSLWFGLRPIRRPNPGEEIKIVEENFLGWMMEVQP